MMVDMAMVLIEASSVRDKNVLDAFPNSAAGRIYMSKSIVMCMCHRRHRLMIFRTNNEYSADYTARIAPHGTKSEA